MIMLIIRVICLRFVFWRENVCDRTIYHFEHLVDRKINAFLIILKFLNGSSVDNILDNLNLFSVCLVF